jgi:hypothetical protein
MNKTIILLFIFIKDCERAKKHCFTHLYRVSILPRIKKITLLILFFSWKSWCGTIILLIFFQQPIQETKVIKVIIIKINATIRKWLSLIIVVHGKDDFILVEYCEKIWLS